MGKHGIAYSPALPIIDVRQQGGGTVVKRLFGTDSDLSSFILRVLLGIVFFPHGAQKVFGWFGGAGFGGTMTAFTEKLGIPAFFAFLAVLAESLGSVCLIAGFLTRVAAFGIACNMVVAVFMLHLKNGFFMNWFGKQQGEGFEYHILVVAITLALMIKGGGIWSVDGALTRNKDH
ncbi:MAG TPA: DoxX family protein [Thermodesulfovibrionales bacterium]|jgi:putative oxidoreductase|nr:DoxX family protein [Thermodesulfovibrionales bacterium]